MEKLAELADTTEIAIRSYEKKQTLSKFGYVN